MDRQAFHGTVEGPASDSAGRILVVDDDAANIRTLQAILEAGGYDVATAWDGISAIKMAREAIPDLILLDIMMPGIDGFDVCKKLKKIEKINQIPVIFLTAMAGSEDIVRGFRAGAVDYVTKPFRREELLARVKTHVRLRRTEQALRRRIASFNRTRRMVRIAAGIEEVVAQSPAMQAVVDKALLFHQSPGLPVLVEGETGTGKEIIARIIHYGDGGVDTPFVDVNIPAIPAGLFESELFGYEAGAFTGASSRGKPGKLEEAGEGTLFLDEIGDLSLELQPKLLRVLQENAYYRLGGKTKRSLKARVVSASNQKLDEMLAAGRFRADLFHRIHIGYIHILPLRYRREEIPALADLFLAKAAKGQGVAPKTLSDDAMSFIMQYHWPGNVRELSNTLHRASILSRGDAIRMGDVEPLASNGEKPGNAGSRSDPAHGRTLTLTPRRIEAMELPEHGFDLNGMTETVLLKALEKFDGNKSQTARYLGISRHSLHRRLLKLPGEIPR